MENDIAENRTTLKSDSNFNTDQHEDIKFGSVFANAVASVNSGQERQQDEYCSKFDVDKKDLTDPDALLKMSLDERLVDDRHGGDGDHRGPDMFANTLDPFTDLTFLLTPPLTNESYRLLSPSCKVSLHQQSSSNRQINSSTVSHNSSSDSGRISSEDEEERLNSTSFSSSSLSCNEWKPTDPITDILSSSLKRFDTRSSRSVINPLFMTTKTTTDLSGEDVCYHSEFNHSSSNASSFNSMKKCPSSDPIFVINSSTTGSAQSLTNLRGFTSTTTKDVVSTATASNTSIEFKSKNLTKFLGLNDDGPGQPSDSLVQVIALRNLPKMKTKSETKVRPSSGNVKVNVKKKDLSQFLGIECESNGSNIKPSNSNNMSGNKEKRVSIQQNLPTAGLSVARINRSIPSFIPHSSKSHELSSPKDPRESNFNDKSAFSRKFHHKIRKKQDIDNIKRIFSNGNNSTSNVISTGNNISGQWKLRTPVQQQIDLNIRQHVKQAPSSCVINRPFSSTKPTAPPVFNTEPYYTNYFTHHKKKNNLPVSAIPHSSQTSSLVQLATDVGGHWSMDPILRRYSQIDYDEQQERAVSSSPSPPPPPVLTASSDHTRASSPPRPLVAGVDVVTYCSNKIYDETGSSIIDNGNEDGHVDRISNDQRCSSEEFEQSTTKGYNRLNDEASYSTEKLENDLVVQDVFDKLTNLESEPVETCGLNQRFPNSNNPRDKGREDRHPESTSNNTTVDIDEKTLIFRSRVGFINSFSTYGMTTTVADQSFKSAEIMISHPNRSDNGAKVEDDLEKDHFTSFIDTSFKDTDELLKSSLSFSACVTPSGSTLIQIGSPPIPTNVNKVCSCDCGGRGRRVQPSSPSLVKYNANDVDMKSSQVIIEKAIIHI